MKKRRALSLLAVVFVFALCSIATKAARLLENLDGGRLYAYFAQANFDGQERDEEKTEKPEVLGQKRSLLP